MANRVCEVLGIAKPVIAAPMTWITNAEYVASVSNAGGAGVLGFNAGQTTLTRDINVTMERTREQIKKTRALTDKPFGINMMVSGTVDPMTAATLELFEEVRPDFVAMISMGEIAPEIISKLHSLGMKAVYRPISPTIDVLKYGQGAGVDVLVCVGHEAGGHASEHRISTLAMLPAARKAISIPLMAAGAVIDEASAKAVKAIGAEGAYCGTRFVLTEENPTHPAVKQALLEAKAEDMVVVPSTPGWIRMTRNETGLACEEMYKKGATAVEINNFYMGRGGFLNMLTGDLKNGFANADEAIGNIDSIKTVKEVVDEIGDVFLAD